MQTSIENIKDSINKSTQKDFLHKLFFLNSVAKQEYTVVDGKIPLPPALQMGIGGRAIFTGDKSGKHITDFLVPDKTRLSSRKFSSTHRIVYDRTSQLYKEEKVKWNGWYTGQKTVGLDLNLSGKEHCGQALICRQKASRNQNAKEGIMIGIEGTPPLKRSKSINGADMSHSMNAKANKVSAFGLPKDIDINKFAAMETENDKTVQDIYHIPYGVVSKKGKKGKMKVDNKYNIMQQSIADMKKVQVLYNILTTNAKQHEENGFEIQSQNHFLLQNSNDILNDILYNQPSGFLNEYISSTNVKDITEASFLTWYKSKTFSLNDDVSEVNISQYAADKLQNDASLASSSYKKEVMSEEKSQEKIQNNKAVEVDDIDLNIDEFEGDLNGSQIQQIQQYNNLALQQGSIDFANANNSANESHLQLDAPHYSGQSNLNNQVNNQSRRNSQRRQKNDIIQESPRRGGFSLWCC